MDTVVVLPLDTASVVVSEDGSPTLVFQHLDGEAVRVSPISDGATIERSPSGEEWSSPRKYSSVPEAVLAAADMQAFGVRRAGVPTNLFEDDMIGVPAGNVEVEPLDLGGVRVEDGRHLPLVLHTVSNEYWRIRLAFGSSAEFVLEHRSSEVDPWSDVKAVTGLDVPTAVSRLLNDTPVRYAKVSEMRQVLNEADTFFKDVNTLVSGETSAVADIQEKTLNFSTD